MMTVLLQAPPVHAWPTTGESPQELQSIIGRKMPVTHKVGQIDSPGVSLDAQHRHHGSILQLSRQVRSCATDLVAAMR